MESPFVTHRDKVLGHYSTAKWLRKLVLAMWNGHDYPVGLSPLAGLDENHAKAAADMMLSYSRRGEGDLAFMALAEECLARQDAELAAAGRAKELERWMAETERCARSLGLPRGITDDRYNWFEERFGAGMGPDAAAHEAKTANLQ
jgi:hypothetical protein